MWLHQTTDARAYGQWKETYRWPAKGSHAFYILAPTHAPICDNCGRIRRGVDHCPECQQGQIQIRLVGFHGIPVHRYEDTEGKPIPEYTPKQPPPLLEVARRWGLDVKWAATAPFGAAGYYSEGRKQIILGAEDAPVFFHELGHAGHARYEKLLPAQQPEQEAVAELIAATLSRLYGYEAEGHAWNYIAAYAETKTSEAVGKLCYKVLGKVEKVINLILAEALLAEAPQTITATTTP